MCNENYEVKLVACYNEKLIVPQYKKVWRSNYWGDGYYEEVLSGYSYNNISPTSLMLDINLQEKLEGRCDDFFNAIFDSFINRKFIKSADERTDELYRIFMDKKNKDISLILNRDIDDDRIVIVIKKKNI